MTRRIFVLLFVAIHWEALGDRAPREAAKAWHAALAVLDEEADG